MIRKYIEKNIILPHKQDTFQILKRIYNIPTYEQNIDRVISRIYANLWSENIYKLKSRILPYEQAIKFGTGYIYILTDMKHTDLWAGYWSNYE